MIIVTDSNVLSRLLYVAVKKHDQPSKRLGKRILILGPGCGPKPISWKHKQARYVRLSNSSNRLDEVLDACVRE